MIMFWKWMSYKNYVEFKFGYYWLKTNHNNLRIEYWENDLKIQRMLIGYMIEYLTENNISFNIDEGIKNPFNYLKKIIKYN